MQTYGSAYYSINVHVFITMGICLPSHCLETKGGIHFTKPLTSKDGRDTHMEIHEFIKYAAEMG
jgi:hypothetical protein